MVTKPTLWCGISSWATDDTRVFFLRKSISTISNVCAPSKKFKIEATFVLVGPHAEVTLTSWHFPSIWLAGQRAYCVAVERRLKKWHAREQISFSFVLITFDKVFDRHSYQWSCMVELHSNGCFGRSYIVAMWLTLTLPDQYRAFGYRLLRKSTVLFGLIQRRKETERQVEDVSSHYPWHRPSN